MALQISCVPLTRFLLARALPGLHSLFYMDKEPRPGEFKGLACSHMALTPESRTSKALFCFITAYWGDWGAARISEDSFSGAQCLSFLSCLIRTCNVEFIPVRLEDSAPHVGASRAVCC